MTVTDSKIPENVIKRYLFAEMEKGERDEFDEKLFLDDALFFEVADIENCMVDAYAAGTLTADDLTRFERSLEIVSSRGQKISNARSLNSFIGEERPIEVAERAQAKASIWQRITDLLSFKNSVMAYGMTALLVVLALSTGFWIFQNQQKNSELAHLRDQQQRQTELQKELDTLKQRESELQNAIRFERETSGDLADELDRERNKRLKVEGELAKLNNSNTGQPRGQIIASLLLLPVGGRGGDGGSIPDVRIGAETKLLSMRLSLPDAVTSEDRLMIKLNQKVTVKDVVPRISGGKKSINVKTPVQSLNRGRNRLEVLDAVGRSISSYEFNVVDK